MNMGQLVADTIELTERLTQRFGKRQLIILGHSWGSILGLMAVHQRPDLYSAFVSTGLIANFAEGQRVAYRFLLAESQRRGNRKALAELTGLGAPPYAGADAIAQWKRCGRWLGEFGAVWHSPDKFNRVGWMLSAIEYSWPEKLRCSRTLRTSRSGRRGNGSTGSSPALSYLQLALPPHEGRSAELASLREDVVVGVNDQQSGQFRCATSTS
jgi:pimeloyl-ACP methyl ester carboxylesterase